MHRLTFGDHPKTCTSLTIGTDNWWSQEAFEITWRFAGSYLSQYARGLGNTVDRHSVFCCRNRESINRYFRVFSGRSTVYIFSGRWAAYDIVPEIPCARLPDSGHLTHDTTGQAEKLDLPYGARPFHRCA